MPTSLRWAVRGAFVTAITALGAITAITIPGLSLVPFTFQVFGVFLAGGILPARWAALSQLSYIALGILGAPIFAEGQRGLAVLIGPFGGYLWAYPVAAWIMASLVHKSRHSRLRLFMGLISALAIIYLGGMVGLVIITHASWTHAFLEGVLPFIGWDVIKAVLAWPIISQLHHWVEKSTAKERLSA